MQSDLYSRCNRKSSWVRRREKERERVKVPPGRQTETTVICPSAKMQRGAHLRELNAKFDVRIARLDNEENHLSCCLLTEWKHFCEFAQDWETFHLWSTTLTVTNISKFYSSSCHWRFIQYNLQCTDVFVILGIFLAKPWYGQGPVLHILSMLKIYDWNVTMAIVISGHDRQGTHPSKTCVNCKPADLF